MSKVLLDFGFDTLIDSAADILPFSSDLLRRDVDIGLFDEVRQGILETGYAETTVLAPEVQSDFPTPHGLWNQQSIRQDYDIALLITPVEFTQSGDSEASIECTVNSSDALGVADSTIWRGNVAALHSRPFITDTPIELKRASAVLPLSKDASLCEVSTGKLGNLRKRGSIVGKTGDVFHISSGGHTPSRLRMLPVPRPPCSGGRHVLQVIQCLSRPVFVFRAIFSVPILVLVVASDRKVIMLHFAGVVPGKFTQGIRLLVDHVPEIAVLKEKVHF